MSIFGPAIFGGYGFGPNWFGSMAVPDPHPAPANPDQVKAEEPLDRSQAFPIVTAAGMLPGFDEAPLPSDWTRWQQRRFSTIAFIHAVVINPIISGKQVVAVKDAKGNQALADKIKADAEETFLPRVMDWLPGALECPHFGRWLQEVIWDVVYGSMVPVGFRPLLPGEYIPYKDATGQFSGYQYRQEYRDKRYAFLAVHGEHVDPIFGWSRNDNCREEWWRIRQSEINADRTERKASGIQMGIGAPNGESWFDDSGTAKAFKDMVQTIVDSAQQGQTFMYPLMFWDKKTLKDKPELAGMEMFKITPFDWGNTAPAVAAGIQRRNELKVDIVRAWYRPEREAMQGQHGTNAESETQGEIGTTDSERLGQAVFRQFSRQVINTWAVNKYGPDAADMVAMEMAPLSDPQQKALQDLTKTIAQNTTTGDELLAHVALRPLLERVEVPLVPEDEANKKIAQMQADKAAKAQQQPPMNGDGANGVPANGVNGNGQKNGNGKRSGFLNRLERRLKP